jgi:hypothetical protein
LLGKLIIRDHNNGLGSGSYLMYPWVNRIEENPFPGIKPPYHDQNGTALHGFYVDEERNATIYVPS